MHIISTFFIEQNPILFLLAIPFLGILCTIGCKNSKLIQHISLLSSILTFLYSLFLWFLFDPTVSTFQFVTTFFWLPGWNICLTLGIDGISILFILLTTFLIPLCLLTSYGPLNLPIKHYILLILMIELCLLLVFCCLDIFFFFVFFETVLIPMFLLIGMGGSRERKIRASYFLFFFTLVGSIFMFLSILKIYSQTGTTDYQTLLQIGFQTNPFLQKIFWLSFFFAFAVKVPMFPFHIWLPEAHVEAPTAGSVILAGILLKLGAFGILRFLLPLFPLATIYFSPIINVFALLGILYASLTAIRQTDIKRIIAYSSVAHMNLIVLGLFSLTIEGLEGSILQMLSHGLISSSLFFSIGVLYDRYHSRLIANYSGLVHTMPIFSVYFLFFILANIGLPGTSSFIGEFLIFSGLFVSSPFITFGSVTGVILSGCYSLFLFNRISFGNLRTSILRAYYDLTIIEILIFSPLVIGILIMGIYPTLFLNTLHTTIIHLLLTIW